MMNAGQLLALLAEQEPAYWSWLQVIDGAQLQRVKDLAKEMAPTITGEGNRFLAAVRGLTSYTNQKWATPAEEPPVEEAPAPEDLFDEAYAQSTQEANQNILWLLSTFLTENELPSSLLAFIQEALAQKKPYAQIIAELRQTPEYLAAYPENALRKEAGYTWMPEAEIRAYRDEAKRLAKEYLSLSVSNTEIASLMARNVSLAEWEKRLQTQVAVKKWGPVVQQVFEQELGRPLSDDRLFAFMSPDISTPELDRAYEHALYRGMPAQLGLNIRPEEEAEILTKFGISPEKAFQGYQGIVGEMPRFERLGYIEYYLNQNAQKFPNMAQSLEGVSFGTLFRALQLKDPDAIEQLRQIQAREIARFQAGGGPTGLLTRYGT